MSMDGWTLLMHSEGRAQSLPRRDPCSCPHALFPVSPFHRPHPFIAPTPTPHPVSRVPRPFDPKRYAETISVCQLIRDLENFSAGDQQEVPEPFRRCPRPLPPPGETRHTLLMARPTPPLAPMRRLPLPVLLLRAHFPVA